MNDKKTGTALIRKMTIDRIIEYIELHLESGKRMSIHSLSAYSGYCRRHLQRIFLLETGMRLGEYIRRRRLSRAALLCRLSLRGFQDIACSLGFDSQQTFNREFRKTAGVTPGQYRSQPEWRLLPLAGRAGISFSVPVPERVHLPEGRILGRPLTFSGRIHEVRDNGAAAFSESVFACQQEAQWLVVTAITPVGGRKGDYEVRCGVGAPDNPCGNVFSWAEGDYLSVTFETTTTTHAARADYIYMNILPTHGVVRTPGVDILVFRYHEERVFCTLYIPVS